MMTLTILEASGEVKLTKQTDANEDDQDVRWTDRQAHKWSIYVILRVI